MAAACAGGRRRTQFPAPSGIQAGRFSDDVGRLPPNSGMVLDRGLQRPCQQASVDAIWPRRSSPHAARPAARLMLGPARCRLRSPAVSVKRGRVGPLLEIKAPPTRHAARLGTATRLRRIRRPLMTLDGKSARATPNTPPRVDVPHPSREYSPGHRTFTLAQAPKREQALPVPPMQTLGRRSKQIRGSRRSPSLQPDHRRTWQPQPATESSTDQPTCVSRD